MSGFEQVYLLPPLSMREVVSLFIRLKKHQGSLFTYEQCKFDKPDKAITKKIKDPSIKIEPMYFIKSRVKGAERLFMSLNYITDQKLNQLSDKAQKDLEDTIKPHPYSELYGRLVGQNKSRLAHTHLQHVYVENKETGVSIFVKSVLERPNGLPSEIIYFIKEECLELLVALNKQYVELMERLKFAPFALKVRNFEKVSAQQYKDCKHYLRSFFKADHCFYFCHYYLVLDLKEYKVKAVDNQLADLTALRKKVISDLKNHQYIDNNTRYIWKVSTREPILNGAVQLVLSLLLVKRELKELDTIYFEMLTDQPSGFYQRIKQLIDKAASEKKLSLLAMPVDESLSGGFRIAQDRIKYNELVELYFEESEWASYYRISCKQANKLLFGKGILKEK